MEQAIAAHPAVLECAVVAIPHAHWGERPKAFVTLKRGRRGDRRGADRALPGPHRALQGPDAVEFGPLPKTSTGKVQKYVLREREWGDRTTRIN